MKTLQRTLTIIKPDAVKKNAVGDIIEQFEKNGFHILAMKMLEISQHQGLLKKTPVHFGTGACSAFD